VPADRATVQNLAPLARLTRKSPCALAGTEGTHTTQALPAGTQQFPARSKGACHEPDGGGNEARRTLGGVLFLKCRGGWRERQDIKQQIEHSVPAETS
jgi:hypothetical protein